MVIIKVGGSFFDLPELGPRLQQFLATFHPSEVLLIPGGGRFVDEIRALDRMHHLGESTSHWLALQAMSLTARLLHALLPDAAMVDDLSLPWPAPMAILDALPYFHQNPRGVAESWEMTSDSLAAVVAVRAKATRLILLKSTSLPPGMSWPQAAEAGYVDVLFPESIRPGLPNLQIEAVNFREWQP